MVGHFEHESLQSIAQTIYAAFSKGIDFHCNIIDREYRIVWHNSVPPASSRVGRYCYDFYQKRTTPCERCPVSPVFASGVACILERERFERLADGKPRWGEIRAYPICGRDGSVQFVLTLGFDITEKKMELERRRKYVEILERRLGRTLKDESAKTKSDRKACELTARQSAVLKLAAQGFTNTEISRILSLSPHTVKSHLINIFNKLGVNDRTEAATAASRLGLI